MTDELAIVRKLKRGGKRGADGYIYNELPVNPDGPEAAAVITRLVEAGDSLARVADDKLATVKEMVAAINQWRSVVASLRT